MFQQKTSNARISRGIDSETNWCLRSQPIKECLPSICWAASFSMLFTKILWSSQQIKVEGHPITPWLCSEWSPWNEDTCSQCAKETIHGGCLETWCWTIHPIVLHGLYWWIQLRWLECPQFLSHVVLCSEFKDIGQIELEYRTNNSKDHINRVLPALSTLDSILLG